MTDQTPDWFLLLRAWRQEDLGERGLTLPFLVGARAYARNQQGSLQDARAMLDEMITMPVENHVIEIAWCSGLAAAILTVGGSPSKFQPKVGFRAPDAKEMCVLFGLDLQTRWNSSDENELLDSLIEECEIAILDQTFSRDSQSRTYKPFEPWEHQFIDRALNRSNQT